MAPTSDSFDLGLRFIVEPASTELSSSEFAQLSDLRPAGIMLRKRNFLHGQAYDVWLKQYERLLTDVRQAIARPQIIVSIDHEGGAVHRFPPPITRFPYAALYGSSLQAVEAIAKAMAQELVACGVNLSFAPVADIHSNPANPVINQRAFGTSAVVVSDAARLFAQTLRVNGIVPCAKHFPGHGDTAVDSHFAVPVLSASLRELEQRELIPFQALIADGIEIIMSGHLVVPALDPNNPATISSPVLSDLLRGTLGFSGLTIADALGMKGIHETVMSGAFASKAHYAGLDLFLVAGDALSLADALRIRDELGEAINRGEVDSSSMRSTEQRIRGFLDKLAQYPVSPLEPQVTTEHSNLSKTLAQNQPFSGFVFAPQGFE